VKIYLRNFILIIAIFISINTSFAKDIKIIQVSGVEFSGNNNSIEQLNKLIKSVNNDSKVDFVVFTGDNIKQSNSELLKAFLKSVNKLKVPYYIEIGDKDCFKAGGLSKEEYIKIVNKNSKLHLKSFNYTTKKENIVFIFLDGAKEFMPSANGYFKNDTIAWLDKKLNKIEKNKKQKVIIFQHFPIIKLNKTSLSNTYNAEIYEKILSEHKNVLAIFSGHFKTSVETQKDGILHYITSDASGANAVYREIYIIKDKKNNYEIYSIEVPYNK